MRDPRADVEFLRSHVQSGDLQGMQKLPAIRQLFVLHRVLQQRGYHCQPKTINVSIKTSAPAQRSELSVQAIELRSKEDASQPPVIATARYDLFESIEEVVMHSAKQHVDAMDLSKHHPVVTVEKCWDSTELDALPGPLLNNAHNYWTPRALVLLQAMDLEMTTPPARTTVRSRL